MISKQCLPLADLIEGPAGHKQSLTTTGHPNLMLSPPGLLGQLGPDLGPDLGLPQTASGPTPGYPRPPGEEACLEEPWLHRLPRGVCLEEVASRRPRSLEKVASRRPSCLEEAFSRKLPRGGHPASRSHQIRFPSFPAHLLIYNSLRDPF